MIGCLSPDAGAIGDGLFRLDLSFGVFYKIFNDLRSFILRATNSHGKRGAPVSSSLRDDLSLVPFRLREDAALCGP